jgi:hypothetical protein
MLKSEDFIFLIGILKDVPEVPAGKLPMIHCLKHLTAHSSLEDPQLKIYDPSDRRHTTVRLHTYHCDHLCLK